MDKPWQLQEAKNRFSEVINKALKYGPQVITRHGEETVVVMSIAAYKKHTDEGKSLYKILRDFPKNIKLDLNLDKSIQLRPLQL